MNNYGLYLHFYEPNTGELWTTQSKEMYWTISLVGHFECSQQNGCVGEQPLLYFERAFLRILKY